jgi:HD-GYP domain-containing protein (c-di-GMP phosphodiesterase class II)
MSHASLLRIDPLDIRVGVPTRVDIFGADGQLLLARGSTVHREDSVERLQESGFKMAAPAQGRGARRPDPVFQRMDALADVVTDMERALLEESGLPSFASKVQALAQSVIACCDEDHNAALAQAYLDHHHPYSVLHHVLVGIGVGVLSRSEGWSDADRLSLVAAALSHDIGALALRQALGQAASLDEEQRTLVREHPDRGVQMLDGLGVRDALWLRAVQDHHERMDGSGYPQGLCLDGNAAGALMAVADGYAAMLRPRPYRERKLSLSVLDDLRKHAGTWYDTRKVQAIADCFGTYHAGSIVRLASGQMAVVTRHVPERPEQPDMMLIAVGDDHPMERPSPIDAADPDHAIVAALQPEISLRFRSMVNKCWSSQGA